MAMAASQLRKPRPPLDAAKLEELAISYVGRFATSAAKLRAYLLRKLRERGWAGPGEPPVEMLADRLTQLGYIDDCAYALAKARSLGARGFGRGRVRQALAQAGISEENSGEANDLAAVQAYEAALRFARRRSFGPFAAAKPDLKSRERAIAAMIRAGHEFGMARAIIDLAPGEFPDCGETSNISF
jgi:regulatory protein